MSEFSRPSPRTGAAVPPEVRAKYEQGFGRLEDLPPAGQEPAAQRVAPDEPTLASVPSDPPPDVDEGERREFARCVLGGRAYSRRYPLFGKAEAVFSDRLTAVSDALYAALTRDRDSGLFQADTDAQWEAWVARYRLAAGLQELSLGAGQPRAFPLPPESGEFDYHAKVRDLMSLPRPLFLALADAAIDFENFVNLMVARAGERSFWPAGGDA